MLPIAVTMKSKQKYKFFVSGEDATDSVDENHILFTGTEEPILNQEVTNNEDGAIFSRSSCKSLEGLANAFASCCFYAIGSVIAKLCKGSLGALQIVLIRCLVQLLFCIPPIAYYRLEVFHKFPFTIQLTLLIRGILGGIGIILVFYSFQNLPLGDASAVVFSSSIYTVILARILLKEKIVYLDIIVLVATITGVILITKPTGIFSEQKSENKSLLESNNTVYSQKAYNVAENQKTALGFAAAFVASLMISGSHIALRKLPTVHYVIPLLYLSVTGVIVASFPLLLTQKFLIPSDGKYWGYAILIGICGFVGQVFMTKAYQMEKAGPVAIVRQCDIVFAYIFQVIIFADPLEIVSCIGATLIFGGSLVLALKKLVLSTKSCDKRVENCVVCLEL